MGPPVSQRERRGYLNLGSRARASTPFLSLSPLAVAFAGKSTGKSTGESAARGGALGEAQLGWQARRRFGDSVIWRFFSERIKGLLCFSCSNCDAVKYDMDGDAIDFIHNKYGVEGGVAPRITPFIQKLAANKECDDDFLRSWLIVAICTFVCPTTSLGISARCYPSVVDVSAVKNLKWCDFVVDQLRISRNKMNKRNSVKGCVFFLLLLYLDSLEHDLEISNCKPRLGAWNKQVMEKVVQMDRNDDGSFGRLKLKQTKYTIIDTSIGACFADIERFVSSKVPTGLSSQDKKRLTEAFEQACDGFSQLMGRLLQSVSEVVQSSSAERQGRRTEHTEDEDDVSDHVSDGQNDPGATNMSISEEEFSDRVSDEDSYEEEEDSYEDDEDSYQEADTEDEDEPIAASLSRQPRKVNVVGEQAKQDDVTGQQTQQAEATTQQALQPEDAVAAAAAVQDEMQRTNAYVHEPNPPEVVEQQPTSPGAQQQDHANNCPQILVSTPAPVPAPPHEPSCSKRKVISRKRRLRLPEKKEFVNLVTPECLPSKTDTLLPQEDIVVDIPSSDNEGIGAMRPPKHNAFSAHQSTSKPILSPKKSIPVGQGPSSSNYDPPPSCDILGFAEQQASAQGLYPERPIWLDDTFLDNLSYEDYNRLEAEALSVIRKSKAQKTSQAVASEQSPAANVFGKSIPNYSVSKSNELETPADLKFHQSTSIPSAISSGTPVYQPPPRRIIKPSFAMQSPFYQERTNPYKCSKEVIDVYNAVCRFVSGRTTRSSQSPKKKPGYELGSPVAEIAICAMNEFDPDKKTRKKIPKRVLPLRVATFIQKNEIDVPEVKRVFRRSENHLDRHDMVMFPVLQKWKDSELDEEVGHYFLLVLNLRDLQFEVLDSMRTLQDRKLRDCCATLMDGIKTLWKMHYPDSKKKIEGYYIEYIQSPQQITNVDCGFHMLMNAEEWKGRHEPSYKGSDIPNIRKLLTYQWISHEKNDVGDWRSMLGLAKM
ncbi:hypothetical protein EJB05_30365, partial [Eragrostis curvula]